MAGLSDKSKYMIYRSFVEECCEAANLPPLTTSLERHSENVEKHLSYKKTMAHYQLRVIPKRRY